MMGKHINKYRQEQFYIDYDENPEFGATQAVWHVGDGCFGHNHDLTKLVGKRILGAALVDGKIVLTVEQPDDTKNSRGKRD